MCDSAGPPTSCHHLLFDCVDSEIVPVQYHQSVMLEHFMAHFWQEKLDEIHLPAFYATIKSHNDETFHSSMSLFSIFPVSLKCKICVFFTFSFLRDNLIFSLNGPFCKLGMWNPKLIPVSTWSNRAACHESTKKLMHRRGTPFFLP